MTSRCRRTRRLPRCRTIVPTISNRKQRTTHMNESCGRGERPHCRGEASLQSGAMYSPPHNFPAGTPLSSPVPCAACFHQHLLENVFFPTQRNASASFLNSKAERAFPRLWPWAALNLTRNTRNAFNTKI